MGMEGVEVFPKMCFAKEDWFCGIFVGATWGRGGTPELFWSNKFEKSLLKQP